MAKGCKGQLNQSANPGKQKGPIAVWGQIRGAKELLEGHSEFYRLDHPYIGRNNYYRLTKNDFQPSKIVERPADRWERLKSYFALKVEDWRKDGSHILLALSMPATYDFFGIQGWEQKIKAEIAKHTDRKIVVRQRKETRPLEEHMRGAKCVVTWASNTCVNALMYGVPVFTLGPSIARPVSGEIKDIESPTYPDREPFFRHMAYCQFKIDEFESGYAQKTAEENWASETACSKAA